MPAGLNKIGTGTSSQGQVVGHLPCRGGMFLMDGSSNTVMFYWKRAHLPICPCYRKAMPQASHWLPKM